MPFAFEDDLSYILDALDFTDSGDDDDDSSNGGPGGNGPAGNNPGGNANSSANPFGAPPIVMMPTGGGTASRNTSDPADLIIDYNERFANADPALFRDAVVDQLMGVLIGKNKPNALLIGPAGAGKTKVVEEVARLIATGSDRVPPRLRNSTVYELPLSNIVSGSSLVGQLEEKLKAVLDFICDKDNDAILFIDEMHLLTEDNSATYSKIGQILKPALARGDLRCIGATTLQEATTFMNDPAFSRRFSRIICDELTREQTIEILRMARGTLAMHYDNRVVIDDATLEMVCTMADKWHAPGMHRPDNALTLLDRACADTVMDRVAVEAKLKASDPTLYQQLTATPILRVSERRIKRTAMALTCGHSERDQIDFDELDARLARIKGQGEPISAMVRELKVRDLELFDTGKPLAILCAGSSGVGKTAVARIIAETLTGNEPITLNMTEYSEPMSQNRLLGSPAGYVGSTSKRELPFDILQSNPYQVILLDELEKSHPSVQRLFMSALEDGRLKNMRGVEWDFSHTIIIATTNAGAGSATTRSIGFAENAANKASLTAESLSNWFDPEFLNRFTLCVQFNDIPRDTYCEILAETYRREAAAATEARPTLALPDELPAEDLERIAEETFVPQFGARPASRSIQTYINEIALGERVPATAPATTADDDVDNDDEERNDDAD